MSETLIKMDNETFDLNDVKRIIYYKPHVNNQCQGILILEMDDNEILNVLGYGTIVLDIKIKIENYLNGSTNKISLL